MVSVNEVETDRYERNVRLTFLDKVTTNPKERFPKVDVLEG